MERLPFPSQSAAEPTPSLAPVEEDALPLPEWTQPANMTEAAIRIGHLAKNTDEYAYLVGRDLLWVKRQLRHRDFTPWLLDNVKLFSARTARRLMAFAKRCMKENRLLRYEPGKPVIMTDFPESNYFAKDITLSVKQFHFAIYYSIETNLKRVPRELRLEASKALILLLHHTVKEMNKNYPMVDMDGRGWPN
jgi:hypothetical protein